MVVEAKSQHTLLKIDNEKKFEDILVIAIEPNGLQFLEAVVWQENRSVIFSQLHFSNIPVKLKREPIVDGVLRQAAQTNNEACFSDQQRWEIIDLCEDLEDPDGLIVVEVVESYIRNCYIMIEDPIVTSIIVRIRIASGEIFFNFIVINTED